MRRLLPIFAAVSLLACQSPSSSSAPEAPKKDVAAKTKTKPKKSDDPDTVASTSASASTAVVDTTPPHLEERDYEITHFDDKATIDAFIPSNFVDHHNGEWQAPPPKEYDYGMALIAFNFGSYSCSGACKDADYERELHATIGNVMKSAAAPNYNTGDAELDAVRLDVTELESGKLPDGEYIAIRVVRPKGLDAPESVDELHVVCGHHRKGDDFYIVVSGTVHTTMWPNEEKTVWPLLIEGCKKSVPKLGRKIGEK